jgi:protein-S-isoprenylcysteine O-methyltransferase
MSLPLPTPAMLVVFMAVGEGILMRGRLSKDRSRTADRGSLRMLFIIIPASVTLAWWVGRLVPQARFDALFASGPTAATILHAIGLILFVAALGLRWYSMAYLGRLFTFDVAIAEDHRVIDTGPYRFVRHPAYTGSLLSFVGLGLCGGNLLSLVVMLVPIGAAFLHRMAIEEAALTAALGARYADYVARTKRLVPFVY